MSDNATTQRDLDGAGLRIGELTTTDHRDGDTHTLRLFGELDQATVEQVHEELERIEATRASTIIIDLSGLTFMDSTGIRLIMRAHARAHTAPHDLALRRGRPAVQRVFTICAVESRLPFID